MKTLLILNPKSGKNQALKDKHRIDAVLSRFGEVVSYVTAGREDGVAIRQILKSHPEVGRVVVCGGDGTLNLLLNAVGLREDLDFIFLPYGSVNIFARENDYPKDKVLALKKILEGGKKKKLYPGQINRDRTFLLMNSVGFDSFLVFQVESRGKKWGAFSYLFAFVRYALKYDFKTCYTLKVDEDKEYHGSFIVISKCKKYGGFLEFTPEASFFSSDLHAFVFQGRGFFSLFVLMVRTLLKQHLKWKKAHYVQGQRMKLDGKGYTQMDGEIGIELPAEMESGKGVWFVLP